MHKKHLEKCQAHSKHSINSAIRITLFKYLTEAEESIHRSTYSFLILQFVFTLRLEIEVGIRRRVFR